MYDFTIIKLARPVASVHEIDESMLLPMEAQVEIQAIFAAVFPGTRWSQYVRSDGTSGTSGRWAYPDKPGWIEVTLRGDPTSFHVATSYAEADAPLIEVLCAAGGWTACDPQTLRVLGANVLPAGSTPAGARRP